MLFSALSWTLSLVSGEWLLTSNGYSHANGGTVIFLRSLLAASVAFAAALIAVNALDPSLSWRFDLHQLEHQLIDRGPRWFGAVFAATYAALYARFASQWNYVAGLYNRIKEAECRRTENPKKRWLAMSQWKAGFIEDADDLHLATKPMFAAVIEHWGRQDDVVIAFELGTVGGKERLKGILSRVDVAMDRAQREYARRARRHAARRIARPI